MIVQNIGDKPVTFTSGVIVMGANTYTIDEENIVNKTVGARDTTPIEINVGGSLSCNTNTQYEITLYTDSGTPVYWKGKPE